MAKKRTKKKSDRDGRGQFVPGNPHGGPRPGAGRKPKASILAVSEALGPDQLAKYITELSKIALTARSKNTRVAALRELLDRGLGRAPQTMKLQRTDGTLEDLAHRTQEKVETGEIQDVLCPPKTAKA